MMNKSDLERPYNDAMNKIEVFVPIAETRIVEGSLAPRLPQLKGARIGWLDNMKANAPELLRDVAAVLVDRGANGRDGFRIEKRYRCCAGIGTGQPAHLRCGGACHLGLRILHVVECP